VLAFETISFGTEFLFRDSLHWCAHCQTDYLVGGNANRISICSFIPVQPWPCSSGRELQVWIPSWLHAVVRTEHRPLNHGLVLSWVVLLGITNHDLWRRDTECVSGHERNNVYVNTQMLLYINKHKILNMKNVSIHSMHKLQKIWSTMISNVVTILESPYFLDKFSHYTIHFIL
jgi:hypothetical protein